MPAVSKSQQNYFRMVRAYQSGKLDTSTLSKEFVAKIKKTASEMSPSQTGDFTKGAKKNLPKHVAESLSFIDFLVLDS